MNRKSLNPVRGAFRILAVVAVVALTALSCRGSKDVADAGVAGMWSITGISVTGADPLMSMFFDADKVNREIVGQGWGFEIRNDSTVTVSRESEVVKDGKWSYEGGVLECDFDEMALRLNVVEVSDDTMKLELSSLDGLDKEVNVGLAMAASLNVKLLLSCSRQE